MVPYENVFVDIKIDFRNDFNDLNYTLKKDNDILLGVVPLPRLRNNVILEMDIHIDPYQLCINFITLSCYEPKMIMICLL